MIGVDDNKTSATALGTSFSKPVIETFSSGLHTLHTYVYTVKNLNKPVDEFDESSWIVLHCCDNLCEYILIRSFSSCGSRLCESIAPTSIIFLCKCHNTICNINGILLNYWMCFIRTYVAKSWTIRFNAFNSFFCGTVLWFSRNKSPLWAIMVGLLFTGFGNKCVRSLGSTPWKKRKKLIENGTTFSIASHKSSMRSIFV